MDIEQPDLDTLLGGLSGWEYDRPDPHFKPIESTPLSEEDVNQFVLNNAKQLVEHGMKAIEELRPVVTQGQNPEEIEALSRLIDSTSGGLDQLNKINLHNKKSAEAARIKKMEIEARKELAGMASEGPRPTNIILATREEIFAKLFDVGPPKQLIDVEPMQLEDK